MLKASFDLMTDEEYNGFLKTDRSYPKYAKDMGYERKINGGK